MYSKEYVVKEVFYQTQGVKNMYTHVDELIGARLEMKDYVEGNKPGMLCLSETKLDSRVNSKALGI